MAWTVDAVTIDADKDDVGTVAMTWNTGGPDAYSWGKRVQLTAANRGPILAEATADKDAELANRLVIQQR